MSMHDLGSVSSLTEILQLLIKHVFIVREAVKLMNHHVSQTACQSISQPWPHLRLIT